MLHFRNRFIHHKCLSFTLSDVDRKKFPMLVYNILLSVISDQPVLIKQLMKILLLTFISLKRTLISLSFADRNLMFIDFDT